MTLASLEASWAELDLIEGGPSTLRARVIEGLFVEERPAFVAIDWEGLRHLLLPTDLTAEVPVDARSGGIRISQRDLVDGGRTDRFVDVACLKPHLNPLFDVVAGEMLGAAASTPLRQVPMACNVVLERWRELIEKASGEHVGVQTIVGAWGELWFVREAVRRGVPLDDLWTGPLGGIHDLRGRNGVELEVKSTQSRGPLLVEIHGIDQLEIPPGGALYLGVLRLRRAVVDGETLADLARSSVEAGGSASVLDRLLAAIGLSVSLPEASEHRFAVDELRFYEVTVDFPRIVHSSLKGDRLPPGTASLTYQLDLTGEPPIPLHRATFERVLASLGDEQQ